MGGSRPDLEPVSRQSNLIVESSKQVSDQQLRQMLIDEIKRQGKPYGFYFEHVTGGYTTTGRSSFQSFQGHSADRVSGVSGWPAR